MQRELMGVTLMECLVALAIMAILSVLAVPSFRDLLARRTVLVTAEALVDDLRFARTEALKRGGQVSVCSSANGLACSQSAVWVEGWIVFVDGGNTAVVEQFNREAYATVNQTGDGNTSTNSQTFSTNVLTVNQTGDGNNSDINQDTFSTSVATVQQDGNGTSSTVYQAGRLNEVLVDQLAGSDGSVSEVTQLGIVDSFDNATNFATVRQTDIDNFSDIDQDGYNGTATVDQSGPENASIIRRLFVRNKSI